MSVSAHSARLRDDRRAATSRRRARPEQRGCELLEQGVEPARRLGVKHVAGAWDDLQPRSGQRATQLVQRAAVPARRALAAEQPAARWMP
jgi:hypothetical protein